MKKLIAAACGALLSLSGIVVAHSGGEHVMGVVKTIDSLTITLAAQGGKTRKVHTDGQTKFEKSGAPASLAELKVGERVVVHAMRHGEMLHATLVKFGKPPKQSRTNVPDAGTNEPVSPRHAH